MPPQNATAFYSFCKVLTPTPFKSLSLLYSLYKSSYSFVYSYVYFVSYLSEFLSYFPSISFRYSFYTINCQVCQVSVYRCGWVLVEDNEIIITNELPHSLHVINKRISYYRRPLNRIAFQIPSYSKHEIHVDERVTPNVHASCVCAWEYVGFSPTHPLLYGVHVV